MLQIAGIVPVVGEEEKALGVVIELSLRSKETTSEYDRNDVAVDTGRFEPIEDGPPAYRAVNPSTNSPSGLPRSSFVVTSSPARLFATITRVR